MAGDSTRLAPLPPDIPDHTLIELIGRGAYGEVWLARNVLGELRAIKVIHRHRFDSDHTYEREFEGLKRYEPVSRGAPGLVAVLHVGRQDAAGYYYYVMELADQTNPESEPQKPEFSPATPRSSNLDAYTPRTLKSELAGRQRLPVDECVQIGLALVTALEHLHNQGLVHRDIKPSNVIFVNGQPKLADIGLIARIDATMSFVGTEGYIPPEGPGTPQADLYSLGKVLYEISSGKDRTAFPEPLTLLGEAPEKARLLELNAVIHRACDRDPRHRYRCAAEFKAELELLQRRQSVRQRRRHAVVWRFARRSVAALAAAALLGVALREWTRWSVRQAVGQPVLPAAEAAVFVLPIRVAETNGAPGDLCSRITDAFIDSLGLLTNQGLVVGPRKSGWSHLTEAEQFRRVTNAPFAMRYALTGQANLSTNNDSSRRAEFHEAQGSLSGARDARPSEKDAGGESAAASPISAPFTLALTLHDLRTGRPLWTETFRGGTNDIIAIEWQAIATVAGSLQISIATEQCRRIAQLLTNNLEALGWVQRSEPVGREKGFTQAACNEVMRLSQRALRLDNKYAEAHYQDGFMRRLLAGELHPAYIWPDVANRMRTILDLDDTHAAAIDQLAGYELGQNRDWKTFHALYARCLSAMPEDLRRGYHAFYLRICGRLEEARIEQARFETAGLTDIWWLLFNTGARWVHREHVDNLREIRRGLQIYPDNADLLVYLAHTLVALGRYDEGLAVIDEAQAIFKRQELTALQACAYTWMGQTAKARQITQELLNFDATGLYTHPYFMARVYAALGEKEKALDWLQKAADDRSEHLYYPDWGGLRTDCYLDSLRDQPRFWRLCDSVGMGKDQWPRKDIFLTPPPP